jgi:hypothetical protein
LDFCYFKLRASNNLCCREEVAIFESAKTELELLKAAIKKFREKSKSKPSRWDLEAPGGPTWKEVIVDIDESLKNEQNELVSKTLRNMSNGIQGFEAWLSLIPNGDYGSIICGVFKVLISVSKPGDKSKTAYVCRQPNS